MSVNHYAALLSVLIQQSYTINEESSEAFFVPLISVELLDNAIQQLAKLTQSIILILSALLPHYNEFLNLFKHCFFMRLVAVPFPDILKH